MTLFSSHTFDEDCREPVERLCASAGVQGVRYVPARMAGRVGVQAAADNRGQIASLLRAVECGEHAAGLMYRSHEAADGFVGSPGHELVELLASRYIRHGKPSALAADPAAAEGVEIVEAISKAIVAEYRRQDAALRQIATEKARAFARLAERPVPLIPAHAALKAAADRTGLRPHRKRQPRAAPENPAETANSLRCSTLKG